MRELIQIAKDKGMTVKYTPYSNDFIAAYRIVIPHSKDNREAVIMINSTADEERQYESLLQLIDISDEYREYGFIAICGDNQLFLEDRFKINKDSRFTYNYSGGKVIPIAALKGMRFNREYLKQTGG